MGWEYAHKGEYHRSLDPNWLYTPTYLRKIALVQQLVNSLPGKATILDACCGEGVLVRRFRTQGHRCYGIDLNYESLEVMRGDVRRLPYGAGRFGVVLLLDALEHLAYEDQPAALAEIYRVLTPRGYLVLSVPNLAHLNSRIRLLLCGRLDRTDTETNHVGERPLAEYEALVRDAGFAVNRRIGITATLPWLYRGLICRYPARLRWLHDTLEPFARAFPSLAMLTILLCEKDGGLPRHGQIGLGKKLLVELSSGSWRLFSIYTHLTERERFLLFELACSVPSQGVIVEVGSYLGASTSFLAVGGDRRGAKVYAVDTWSNRGMSEGIRDTYAEFVTNTAAHARTIVPLRGESTELAAGFRQRIDLLFIDGDHSHEGVCADLNAWLPKVKEGGIVAFHDYSWADGVRRAVREIIAPIQIEGGHRLDSMYWTRIARGRSKGEAALAACVIVPTCGRPERLRAAIASVQEQSLDVPYEIIVVDNDPGQTAGRVVEELNGRAGQPVRYVAEPRVGLHHARHAGAKNSSARVLVYIDDDIVAPHGWLAALIAPFKEPTVGLVGGKVIPMWEGLPPAWLDEFPGSYLSLLDLGDERKELQWPATVHGCNLAVRSSALYEVGGFNPDGMANWRQLHLRGDGETGLQEKLFAAGYRVVYEPAAPVYHHIARERLTARAFLKRGALEGLSLSFAHIRRTRQRPLSLWLLARSIRAAVRVGRCVADGVRYRQRRLRYFSDACLWGAYAFQHACAALSVSVRSHLLRDGYL